MYSKIVLSIGGSDSGGGAGIQADLRTFMSIKVHGCTAITCITAQNSIGVTGVEAVESHILINQIDALFSDFEIQCLKTGMLLNERIIINTATKLKEYSIPKIIDPVMVSRTGVKLMEDSAINAYRKLPDKIKHKIKNATGIFSSAGPIAVTRIEREKEIGIKSSDSMEAEHPIVKTVNGKKTLYVSPGHLMEIKNVDKKDAVYLKKYLIDHVNKKEFIFSYEWSKGDICLWDNLSILHMASEIKNCRRVMHRITMK